MNLKSADNEQIRIQFDLIGFAILLSDWILIGIQIFFYGSHCLLIDRADKFL